MKILRMCITCWVTETTHTVSMCNTYCYSTATMVARTRHIVILYVHYVSLLPFLFMMGRLEEVQMGRTERPADVGNNVDHDDCNYSVNLIS